MICRSRAPLRLGLAGGGTDVSPFSEMFGGAILNATINFYAYASITPRDDGRIVFHAMDKNQRLEYGSSAHIDTSSGELLIQKGVYNRIIKEFVSEPLAFELITSIDAPAGSGLGSSSTLVVAILGAFAEWLSLPLGDYDIARLAYSIEREDLAMAGGKQDQYAATFGGMNFMEFYENEKVIVNPLRIKEEIIQELEFHLLLFYTKTSRESAKIIEEQRANVLSNRLESLEATKKIKESAYMMKEALLKGQLSRVGEILNFGWEYKKQMASGITNPLIDRIYKTALDAGASGGKISGAGGGGYMFFYCPGNSRYDIIEALNKQGAVRQRYNFLERGLTTWKSNQ